MIKVIIERRTKDREKLATLLRELRAAAIHQSGYIGGETLTSVDDNNALAVISSWRSLDDWKAWEASPARAGISRKIEPLLTGKSVVRTYHILATEATA